jgi:predicted secreted protein
VSWTTSIAIYFIVWWTVLFAVLPWGVRSQYESGEEVEPGTDPGAPSVTGMPAKLVWTTIVATAVFGAFYGAYVTRIVTLDDLATLWGLLR